MADKAPRIVWFRDDLRLSDHPALSAAASSGAPVICVFVLDEVSPELQSPASRPLGGAARWWLAQSLKALADSLPKHQQLILRRGETIPVITKLAAETGATDVYWNEIAIAPYQKLAGHLRAVLEHIGVSAHEQAGDLLVHPEKLRTGEGHGFRVFTPFWRRVTGLGDPPQPLPKPRALKPYDKTLATETLESWKLEPTRPDWAGGLRENWTPGEAAAKALLKTFLSKHVKGYATLRDRPDRPNTSRLSPYLRFGEISPRQIWHAAKFAAAENSALARDIEKFLTELGWREFCRHLLFDRPELSTRNLQQPFDRFPWRHDEKQLKAWQRGQTGYPIVDAGMRELWHTGVMHNRVRMVVASFLVKHLLLDWRAGEDWFWDTLVDADAGSNPANWQWVAGSGADAAPYFRIFNPVLQGEKFDPDGDYVRRWMPELSELPADLIHSPWTAKPMDLEAAGVRLGKTYPEPIVDHKAARERALAAYAKTRT